MKIKPSLGFSDSKRKQHEKNDERKKSLVKTDTEQQHMQLLPPLPSRGGGEAAQDGRGGGGERKQTGRAPPPSAGKKHLLQLTLFIRTSKSVVSSLPLPPLFRTVLVYTFVRVKEGIFLFPRLRGDGNGAAARSVHPSLRKLRSMTATTTSAEEATAGLVSCSLLQALSPISSCSRGRGKRPRGTRREAPEPAARRVPPGTASPFG